MQAQLPTPASSVAEAKKNISVRHLEQLSNLPLGREKPPVEGELPDIDSITTLDELKQWSEDNAKQIQKAVKAGVFGGPDGSPLQWDNAFLAFMEAATTYLRDWSKVMDAVDAYKQGDFETALKRLKESTAEIEKIASLWGMKFQLLCDLTEDTGSWFWNGPYCGAFYSEDPSVPFVGVAFKVRDKFKVAWLMLDFYQPTQGTNPTNWKDLWVDINTDIIQAGEGIVYNTNVSKGVFNGMFMEHEPGRAFDLIRLALNDLVPNIPNDKKQPVRTHVAGHSLGGSYSNLCFTQFTVSGTLPQLAKLGDLYTFGCPRIGYEDFASAAKEHLGPETGSSWRIANDGDLVPQVPPKAPWTHDSPFNHLDNGYHLSPYDVPVAIPTEIGTKTSGPDLWPPSKWTITPHYTTSYYESIRKAMSS
ncbi:hypothetical protein FRC11_013560 [Ceratobasidium sp. 423]|nr:hypothetical protein FRC11_013560 [Ceratobasidium sp. 423]